MLQAIVSVVHKEPLASIPLDRSQDLSLDKIVGMSRGQAEGRD